MSQVVQHLAAVESRVLAACERAGRQRVDVELIAVSKTFPAAAVAEAAAAGQHVFGESRWQEAEPKIAALPAGLQWHFIGGLQRNKVRKILPLFDTLHAVDSVRLASFIDRTAEELGVVARVFLQVNLAGEASKGGFDPAELTAGLDELMAMKRLELLGLMTIPPEDGEPRRWFAGLRDLRDRLSNGRGIPLKGLSMGMSGDYMEAIEEGATHIRVGSAIFGHRAYRVDGELG